MLVSLQYNRRAWVFPEICLPLMSRLQGFVVVEEKPCFDEARTLLGHRLLHDKLDKHFSYPISAIQTCVALLTKTCRYARFFVNLHRKRHQVDVKKRRIVFRNGFWSFASTGEFFCWATHSCSVATRVPSICGCVCRRF